MSYPFEQLSAIDKSPGYNPGASRVVVFLRESSALHKAVIADCGGIFEAKHKWDEVVMAAYHAIGPDISSHSGQDQLQLLAVQKMPRLAIFVFDVNNTSYDWETAHDEVPDIPMVLVEFNRGSERICKAGDDLRRQVNTHVANEHRLNGWAVGLPYFRDQSRERSGPPSYRNTRNLCTRPVGSMPEMGGQLVGVRKQCN